MAEFEAPDSGQAIEDQAPGGQPDASQEESFLGSFDINSVPPEARPHVETLQKEWQGNYTKTRQAEKAEIDEMRRQAEEAKSLQEAMANPELLPHTLRMMGYDPNDPNFLASLGYELAEEEAAGQGQFSEFEDDPRYQQLEGKIGEVQGFLQQQQEEQQRRAAEEADESAIAEDIEKFEGDEQLDPEAIAFVRQYAEANRLPSGRPNTKAAVDLVNSMFNARQQKWIESKKSVRPPNSGIDAQRSFDPMNRDERRAAMAAAAAEKEAETA